MGSKPYQCPTCGDGDTHSYIICNHPLCPDGHDQRAPRPLADPEWQHGYAAGYRDSMTVASVFAIVVITLALFCVWSLAHG